MNECFGCKGRGEKIGVLIAQLGTPDAPTKAALRPYLKEFLGDRRVIEKNRALWWLILNGIILNTRPKRSAALYSRIWTAEGSPLLVYTEKQTNGLRERLQAVHSSVQVVFGMRYGRPSLRSAIDQLIAGGCSRILLVPMYPQYSATTTASIYDAVFSHLLKRRWVPTLKVLDPFYRHPEYIRALAITMNESIAQLKEKPQKIVLSYHGIPEAYVDRGDPYCCQCSETTRNLLPQLDFDPAAVIHTYQSRFGRDPWLVPYTDETIEHLAKEGTSEIAVAAPGFVADCLETLDELGNEGSEAFIEHGGKKLHLIPCLNDHPAWIDALSAIVLEELQNWIEGSKREYVSGAFPCPVKVAKRASLRS